MVTQRAEKIIRNHVLISMGIGAIPLSYFNLYWVRRIQQDMIRQLCRHYGRSYYQLHTKAYLGSLVSANLARKSLRFARHRRGRAGKIASSISHAGIAAASTYAVGMVTARFFHDDIEISDINMERAQDIFNEEMGKGKTFVKDMMSRKKKPKQDIVAESFERKAENEKNIYTQLSKLKELKDQDIVTEEEYEKLRMKYLKELDIG